MDLICKSSVRQDELRHRKELGFDKVEIQLLSWDDKIDLEYIKGIGLEIVNVHSVIDRGDAYLFEDLANDEMFNLLEDFLKRKPDNLKMNFIVHSECSLSDSDFEIAKERVVKLKDVYNTKLLIENSIFIKLTKRGLTIEEFYKPDCIPNLVNRINTETGIENLTSSLLDTTHAVACSRIVNRLYKYENYTIEDYIKAYKSTIHSCHVSSCRGFGLGTDFHGVGFQGSENELDEYLGLFKKHWDIMPNIVLEISEKNYSDCVNLAHCKNHIEKETLSKIKAT